MSILWRDPVEISVSLEEYRELTDEYLMRFQPVAIIFLLLAPVSASSGPVALKPTYLKPPVAAQKLLSPTALYEQWASLETPDVQADELTLAEPSTGKIWSLNRQGQVLWTLEIKPWKSQRPRKTVSVWLKERFK